MELPSLESPVLQPYPWAIVVCAASALSASLLVLQALYTSDCASRLISSLNKYIPGSLTWSQDSVESIQYPREHRAKNALFIRGVLRLGACVALLMLAFLDGMLATGGHGADGAWSLDRPTHISWTGSGNFIHSMGNIITIKYLHQPGKLFIGFYAYLTLLAILGLRIGTRLRSTTDVHLMILLLLAFFARVCVDLVRLALSGQSQAEPLNPWPAQMRFAILGFAAVILPACTPRHYIPLNVKATYPSTPEQTASVLSLITYQFLDPLIWKAYRARKLSYEDLPPLADFDRAEHLKQKSFGHLDPFHAKKKRHLFWGLLYMFRKEYYVMAAMVTIKSLIDFAGPIGIRFLLKYLSDPSNPGPTRAGAHIEAILTQLVFEHTLRIRIATDTEGSNLIGKITNLMSSDLKNIAEGCDFLHVVLSAPIQIVVSIGFLYDNLGWSAMAGAAVMLAAMPIPMKLAKLMSRTQAERMKKTDARVQSVIESINLIRMIKMFAWEKKVNCRVLEEREEELEWYKRQQIFTLANLQLNVLIPTFAMITTYTTYTLWMQQPLEASIVFSSIAVFDILRGQLQVLLWQLQRTIQAEVSLKRLDSFLNNTELLNAYNRTTSTTSTANAPPDPSVVGIRNATFTWDSRVVEHQTIQGRDFKLQINGDLLFRSGKINMIVGPTGCGKTSLLLGLLGEMHFAPSSQDSWFSLPRESGVAYVAQEAWVQSGTIRDNILFGLEYDEERYKKVLSQCALELDLKRLDAADETEGVGERGVTLSGGQKARVSLARAIYSKAAVLLLDDILSPLDIHTSRWIINQCLKGDLIQGRTVLLVTHNIAMVSQISEFVVLLGSDGRIASQGSVTEVFSNNIELRARFEEDYKEEEEKDDQPLEDLMSGNHITVGNSARKRGTIEELAEGHVGWPALKFFLAAFGGTGFWLTYMTALLLEGIATVLQTYWLGVWARAYNTRIGDPDEVEKSYYLAVYGAICAAIVFLVGLAFIVHLVGSLRASRLVHDSLLSSILGAPLRWFDSTPSGRITSRFTQDIRSIDNPLPNAMRALVNLTIRLGLRLTAIIIFSPVFLFPGALLLVIGTSIGQVYIKAQLWVKRETSNARSPVFSHFGAALAGIATIRAYGVEELFKKEAMSRIDNHNRAARSFFNMNRWICVRMDTLGALFSGCLAAYLVYGRQSAADASDTGFSLNMAIVFSSGILWWVRNLKEFEVQCTSLERIRDYISIDQEPAAVPEKAPPAYWPASGNIVVENLVARYSPDGPAVLHRLSFEIKSGERIGVVGRTGSGKTSLTLSLLGVIPTEGNIYYDGIPTHAINLAALRSNITIIPQQPELMSGTVRQNLDPFSNHDEAMLYAALQSAGMNMLQTEGGEGTIGLDTSVSAGGDNFSLGQRQIIALARAIVRRSKVLILDEATAAIDYATDAALQHSIRTELKDITLIIVAHRLQTICDADKIMVLDSGNIVEFDSPAKLLEVEGGMLKSMVDESGDKEVLYTQAQNTPKGR